MDFNQYDEGYGNASAKGAKVNLPEGRYNCALISGELFAGKKDPNIGYFKIVFAVVDKGPFEGAVTEKLYGLDTEKKLSWLKKDMMTIGIMDKVSGLPAACEARKGMIIKVESKPSDDGKFMNIWINGLGKAETAAPMEAKDPSVPF
jgi:hypothetical protein